MPATNCLLGGVVFAGFMFSSGSVLAVEAAAKSAVNVRTGPSTSFGIVGQLMPGENVNVTECAPSNFCFVERNGADGWVSANYLTTVEDEDDALEEGGGSNPDCSFGFVVGPDGPSLSISCGDAPLSPAAASPPTGAQACLFTGSSFNGDDLCLGVGVRNALNATFNNKISSVELMGGAKAMLCDGANLTGLCKSITTDTAPLHPSINNKTSSFAIYVGAPPVPEAPIVEPPPGVMPGPPETLSTGPIDLQQTFTANLDNGAVGGVGVDLWYQAVSEVEKYITPQNGAKIAVGDGSNRGYEGCSVESFSGDSVPLEDFTVGTYACVKTDEGRISQFRVNGFMGTTVRLGYTTWSN